MGVERVTRPAPDRLDRMGVATDHALERGVARDMHQPDRERDRVSLRTAEHALAVPPLGQVREELRHVAGTPILSASSSATSHIASNCGRTRIAARGNRRATSTIRRCGGAPGLWKRPRHSPHDLCSRAELRGRHVLLHAAGEDLHGDVRVRHASDVHQQ